MGTGEISRTARTSDGGVRLSSTGPRGFPGPCTEGWGEDAAGSETHGVHTVAFPYMS